MALTGTRPGGESLDDELVYTPDRPLAVRADRWLIWGIGLSSTLILGPIGFPILAYSFVLLNRAKRAGEATRPWAVTIIGSFCFIDAFISLAFWSMDLFPAHDAQLVQTLWSGYGKLFDAAYYIDFNSTAMGGTANPGEKAFVVMSVLFMYPMRIVGAWAFIKMKRWGLQAMVLTSWMYLIIWVGYLVNLYLWFDARMGSSLFGVTGWWAFLIFYTSPFVMLPYLYTVNREQFSE